MRDEFLFNCEKEIMEANLSLMCGQKEDGLKKIKKNCASKKAIHTNRRTVSSDDACR